MNQLQQLRKFLSDRGLSHNFAAHRLDISPSTLSKLFKGKTECISEDKLHSLHSAIDEWIQSTIDAEHLLYCQIIETVEQHPPGIAQAVLRRVARDVVS